MPLFKPTTLLIVFLLAGFFVISQKASAAVLVKPANYMSIANGLVGYWTFDEKDISGTTAYDKSGNGNNGTIAGAVEVLGKYGQALEFNGTISTKVDVTDAALSSNFPGKNGTSDQSMSFSVWVKIDPSYIVSGSVLCKEAQGGINHGWCFLVSALKKPLFYTDFAGSNGVSGNSVLETGKWYHVVGIYDTTNDLISIYVNGSFDGSASFTGQLPTSASNFSVGYGYRGVSLFAFKGQVDDARVYNRALSSSEISKLYNLGQAKIKSTVSNSGLVGHWPFDEGKGSQAGDVSGNKNIGTVVDVDWTSGKFGKALSFDGNGDYVTLSNPNFSYPVSVSYWLKTNTLLLGGVNVGFYNGSNWLAGGLYNSYYLTNITNIGAQKSYFLNNDWNHIVLVQTNVNNISVYVNGVDRTYTGTGDQWNTGSGSSIGYRIGGPSPQYTNGSIDDVRIYNRALSQAEITALYNTKAGTQNSSQNNKLTNGLVGYWSFNGQDISGTTAYDRSGQNNNGIITGAAPIEGKVGQALSFDGINNYVDLPNGNTYLNPSAGTVAMWYKAKKEIDGRLYDFNNGGCDIISVYINGQTNIRFQHYADCVGTTDVMDQTVDNLNTNQTNWHFIAFTWDVNTDTLASFYDGVYTTQIDDLDTGTFTAANSAIGVQNNLSGREFSGSIDEVRIYNRALSANEIKQLYNLGK